MNTLKFWIGSVWYKNNVHNIENEMFWVLSHRIDDLFEEINDKSRVSFNESNV